MVADQLDMPTGRTSRYHEIRGSVVTATTEGGSEHIETLSQRYLGGPYPWYGGQDQERLVLTIEADKINTTG